MKFVEARQKLVDALLAQAVEFEEDDTECGECEECRAGLTCRDSDAARAGAWYDAAELMKSVSARWELGDVLRSTFGYTYEETLDYLVAVLVDKGVVEAQPRRG